MDHDLAQAKNMKLLLCAFEQLSGLKINFHKSKIFCFGQAKEFEFTYSHLFGCKTGTFPFRYLGIPMHYRKLRNTDWRMVEERFEKRLSGWKGKLLSVGARLVLINTNDQHKKKYRLAKWEILCQPKDQGGLRILDLDLQNRSLLSKWLFKLCNEEGIWQQLLRNKYLRNNTLSQVERKPGDSQFWSSLMGVKAQFLNLGSFILKNGTQVRFWEDTWLGGVALKYQFPSLFNIVRKKQATVAEVLGSSPLNVSFRRSLIGNKLRDLENITAKVMNLNLQEGNDYFKWHLHKSGIFSVRSMYRYLVNNGVKVSMEIWQTKLPLKIKIFLWYLKKRVLLTKDNLGRRNWHGDKSCCFCGTSKTIQHLFLDCSYAKFLWRIRDYAGCFGSQETKLFLTNANQNLSCRCYLEEHIGFVFGPNCSEVNGITDDLHVQQQFLPETMVESRNNRVTTAKRRHLVLLCGPAAACRSALSRQRHQLTISLVDVLLACFIGVKARRIEPDVHKIGGADDESSTDGEGDDGVVAKLSKLAGELLTGSGADMGKQAARALLRQMKRVGDTVWLDYGNANVKGREERWQRKQCEQSLDLLFGWFGMVTLYCP
ncbi:hypothetical protein U9M48_012225 [Paspalum notatum var. saurae]|uniref:Reverse transcriptase zinc-binding domain-containing protein n=1 Tax=Paspalum notatum var. saurae TaxID=547442 RepID=A0AAQ3SYK2_PASNO